jgi:hypothetical protein
MQSRVWATLDVSLDWILDLLATSTHNSQLHWIIAPSLISTLCKSLEHTLSLFPACSVVTSSCLVTASNSARPLPPWMAAPFQLPILQSRSRSYVSRPVCLGIKHQLGLKTRSLLLSDSCRLVDVGRCLWREDGSVVCQSQSAVISLLSVCTIYILHGPCGVCI